MLSHSVSSSVDSACDSVANLYESQVDTPHIANSPIGQRGLEVVSCAVILRARNKVSFVFYEIDDMGGTMGSPDSCRLVLCTLYIDIVVWSCFCGVPYSY